MTQPNKGPNIKDIRATFLGEDNLYASVLADARYLSGLAAYKKCQEDTIDWDDAQGLTELLGSCTQGIASLYALTASLDPVREMVDITVKRETDAATNAGRQAQSQSRPGAVNGMECGKLIGSIHTRESRNTRASLDAARKAITGLLNALEAHQKSICKILGYITVETQKFRP